jgi:hypothetical protein
MKTNMKRQFLLTALFLFAALLAASPARAQSLDTNRDIILQNNRVIVGGVVVGNQSLQNAVTALRRLYPTVNIVMEPGVDQIMIGDVQLHSTEPELALEALSIASGHQFICEKHFSTLSPGNLTNGFLAIRASTTADAKPEKKVAAFNLSAYFVSKHLGMTTNDAQNEAEIRHTVDELRNIIGRTLDALHPPGGGLPGMYGPDPHRKIEFYPDANLLIVIGSEEDLEVARAVIGALPGAKVDNLDTPALPERGQYQRERMRRVLPLQGRPIPPQDAQP